MTPFVALLRGINVGKAKRVPMAELRMLMQTLGYGNVRTLLNSGNVIFDSDKPSNALHADRIHAAILKQMNVDVPLIVKSAAEMKSIAAENALATVATDPSRLLVAFTKERDALKRLDALVPLIQAPEQLLLGEHAGYLLCANGILESKAGDALLGKLGRETTTRNWATVLKILALLE